MKHCGKCKTEKPLSDFSKKKSGHQAWCKPCLSEHNKAKYHSDPKRRELIRQHAKKNQQIIQEKLFSYLQSHPCVQCGETNILTLQFDHLSNKEFEVADNTLRRGWSSLEKELGKCQVLCANCHSIKTAHQLGNWKLKWLARRD